jgi:hypothetical protein
MEGVMKVTVVLKFGSRVDVCKDFEMEVVPRVGEMIDCSDSPLFDKVKAVQHRFSDCHYVTVVAEARSDTEGMLEKGWTRHR